MAEAEVGDDVFGEDPTVNALQERVADLFGHEAALFTPTGSMANVLAVASLVAPGQEVLCEASAHIARAELGAHGAFTGLTMRTWRHPRGQVDLDGDRGDVRPRHGPVLRPHHGGLGREHPQLRRRHGAPARGPRRRCRAWADSVGRRRPPRRRPALERARRHRRPARVVRRVRRRAVRVPVEGARRAGRLAGRRQRRRDRRGPGPAQADGRRDAPGRHPGRGRRCTRSTTTSSGWPTTTRTPGCSPRPAASTRPPSRPTSWSSPRDDAPAFVAGAARGGVLVSRSARAPYAWSPTSTSARPTPRQRRPSSAGSSPSHRAATPR